jgi:transposase-like protein
MPRNASGLGPLVCKASYSRECGENRERRCSVTIKSASALIDLAKIRLNGGTQPRVEIDDELVIEYANAMADRVAFPPVVVFYDGTDYWLADGFHRVKAARHRLLKQIECDVRQGTQQDAQWFSFGANQAHGLRRTPEDKQRAIRQALSHPNGQGLSDREIARHIGCGHSWVSKIRETMTVHSGQSQTLRTGADGRTINTANIGSARKQEPPPKTLRQLANLIVKQEIERRGIQMPPSPKEARKIAIATGHPVAASNNTYVLPMSEEAEEEVGRRMSVISTIGDAIEVLGTTRESAEFIAQLARQYDYEAGELLAWIAAAIRWLEILAKEVERGATTAKRAG